MSTIRQIVTLENNTIPSLEIIEQSESSRNSLISALVRFRHFADGPPYLENGKRYQNSKTIGGTPNLLF